MVDEPTAEITNIPLAFVAPTTPLIVIFCPIARPCAEAVVTTADVAVETPVIAGIAALVGVITAEANVVLAAYIDRPVMLPTVAVAAVE